MTCCVEFLIAGLLALPVPAPVEARVRASLAERWRVEGTRIEMAWARPSGTVRDDAGVSLGGGGREGWLAVTFDSPGAPAQVARVRAGVRTPVPLAARELAMGGTLTAADITWGERTVWGPPRTGASAGPGVPEPGWVVRRPLAAGEELAWPALAPPQAVQAGAPVTLVWQQNGVRVTRAGLAINGAARGGWVRVRVEGRADRLVGRASANGEVSLVGGFR